MLHKNDPPPVPYAQRLWSFLGDIKGQVNMYIDNLNSSELFAPFRDDVFRWYSVGCAGFTRGYSYSVLLGLFATDRNYTPGATEATEPA